MYFTIPLTILSIASSILKNKLPRFVLSFFLAALLILSTTNLLQRNKVFAADAIIVDDSDAGFTPGGQSDGAQPSFWDFVNVGTNGGARYTGNSVNSTPHNWGTWEASGLTGEIEVFAIIPGVNLETPGGSARPLTSGATYTITHAGGTSQVTVDQESNKGGAVSLGTYEFNGTGSVYLNDVVAESGNFFLSFVVFDAISFGDPGTAVDVTPPLIEDVKANTYEGSFYIQAKVTDAQSGVASVTLLLKRGNGSVQEYEMHLGTNDIYSVKVNGIARGENLDYEIRAVDNAGNMASWIRGRGYVTRGSFGKNLGVARWNQSAMDLMYQLNAASCRACSSSKSSSNQNAGDPVNTLNGNLIDTTKIIMIPGRPEIDLHLTYNSQGGNLGIFGESFTHSYAYHLIEMDGVDFTGAFVQYPDGRTAKFEGSSFTPESGIYETLTKTADGYELKFKDLSRVLFDKDGDIIRFEDPNDNGLTFSYGTKFPFTNLSQITSIKADGGREITFDYNAAGLVSKINAPESKTLNFDYNATDDLIKIVDGNGGNTVFEYSDHNMTKKVSPKGHNFFVNSYDSERRVISQTAGINYTTNFQYNSSQTIMTDANGNITKYDYNSDDLLTKLTDARNNSFEYEYDANKNVSKFKDKDANVTEYSYDSKGNKTYEKDPLGNEIHRSFDGSFNKVTSETYKISDHITNYEYDAKGNLTKITNANGNVSTFDYSSFGQLTKSKDFNGNETNYEYHSAGDLKRIIDANGNQENYSYDGLGRLTKFQNKRGFDYKYSYDLNDNLLKVEGPLGYTLKYEYDANNNLTKETDANGGEIKYTYDASDKLTSIKDQMNFETKYTYGNMNERLSEVDPLGRIAKFNHDATFNLVEVVNANGSANEIHILMSYSGMATQTSLTDPLGRLTKFEIDPLQRVSKQVENSNANPADSENNVTTKYDYSATSTLIKLTDANGNVTSYEYDKLDRLTKETNAEDEATKYEYDGQGNLRKMIDPKNFETRYEYDALNRLHKIIDAKGGETKFYYDANSNLERTYDANGVITKYSYDDLDRQSEKIENFVDGGAVDTQTNVKTSYKYDLHGNLVEEINPRGFSTKFGYDADHRQTSITDAKGFTTNFSYDAVDNLVEVKDRNGHSYTNIFDELNRLRRSTNPEGHFKDYEYDKVGNLTKEVTERGKIFTSQYDPLNRVKVETDPYGKTKISAYDPIGNLLSLIDENSHQDNYSYDKVYRLTKFTDAENKETRYVYDDNSNLIKIVDGNGNPTTYSFDEINRLISILNAENEEEKYGYDALENITLKTEADGTRHKYDYDPLYRLAKVTDNQKDSSPTNSDTNVQTKYSYDANGNLLVQTDPLNHNTSFEYNEVDRLIKEVNPLGSNWKYEYDPVGNLTKRTDANSAVTNYSYYPDNEVQKIQYPTYAVEYRYNKTNYPVEMKDNLGTTTWTYDDLERMSTQNDPLTRAISYQYDFVGNLTKLTYPDTRSVSHTYLKNDWLAKSNNSEGYEIKFDRDSVGNPLTLTRTNSSTSKISYDKVYRPTKVFDKQIGSGNHLISRYTYSYNDIGDVTNEIAEYGWRQPAKVVTNFSYDGMHRLTKSESDDNQKTNYSYDAAGNRTKLEEYIPSKNAYEKRAYVYNDANQLIKITIKSPLPPKNVTENYTYDLNGNRIDKLVVDGTGIDKGMKYRYDIENRLIKAQDYQGQIQNNKYKITSLAKTEMNYDGNGRRLVKTYYSGSSDGGKRNEYVFDKLDPIANYSMWGGQRTNLYRDNEQNLMFYQKFKSETAPSGTAYWYHFDGEGNIAATTKHAAQSDHTYRYDEYGMPLPENANWTEPHNEYTLSQKEYDSNMDMFYFGSRYYDPKTGSWLTQDSYRGEIENPMSLHRYMYNYQSPINYVDPYGFSPLDLSKFDFNTPVAGSSAQLNPSVSNQTVNSAISSICGYAKSLGLPNLSLSEYLNSPAYIGNNLELQKKITFELARINGFNMIKDLVLYHNFEFSINRSNGLLTVNNYGELSAGNTSVSKNTLGFEFGSSSMDINANGNTSMSVASYQGSTTLFGYEINAEGKLTLATEDSKFIRQAQQTADAAQYVTNSYINFAQSTANNIDNPTVRNATYTTIMVGGVAIVGGLMILGAPAGF